MRELTCLDRRVLQWLGDVLAYAHGEPKPTLQALLIDVLDLHSAVITLYTQIKQLLVEPRPGCELEHQLLEAIGHLHAHRSDGPGYLVELASIQKDLLNVRGSNSKLCKSAVAYISKHAGTTALRAPLRSEESLRSFLSQAWTETPPLSAEMLRAILSTAHESIECTIKERRQGFARVCEAIAAIQNNCARPVA